jgi:glycosyltransferase involved in cell wall biosynthesis
VLQKLKDNVTFLMVGTLEPRKGYAQALEAFEQLWQEGYQCQLVIVGNIGWKAQDLVFQLNDHVEQGQRLFWLQSISDEYLSFLYESATCLLAASEGEGFGLPLIEAAKYKLPVLARDIKVFREVGEDSVDYFSAYSPQELKFAITDWMTKYRRDIHRSSSQMNISTWGDCSEKIKSILQNFQNI